MSDPSSGSSSPHDPDNPTASSIATQASAVDSAKPSEKNASHVHESDSVTLPVVHSTDDVCNRIRTAFDLNRAIARAPRSSLTREIGYSLTKYEEHKPPTPDQQEILKRLRTIYSGMHLPFRVGDFEEPFHLSISRPGCEYEDSIVPSDYQSWETGDLLEEWYDNASISGYGDVQSLQTKIDPDVRDAREIPASEFTVDPDLLERIRATWAETFIPGNVRVEPYKIHLYGPGGHFRSHRDTPESGLVGTFLVGLGEQTHWGGSGRFGIGGLSLAAARACSWVAFHPDVPHSISQLGYNEYRAVIAFKVFQDGPPLGDEAALRESAHHRDMVAVLGSMTPPYGILLDHKYHMGVSDLNGFDAIVLSAAKQQKGCAVHILPVIISTFSEIYHDYVKNERQHEKQYQDRFRAYVHPFTQAHVDLLLSDGENEEANEQVKWLEGVKDVPFYSRDFSGCVDSWREDSDDINFTGNESDGTREDSVYLSHALLVLPSASDTIN